MLTRIVVGRVFDWNRTVGRSGSTGQAFSYPIKVALGEGDTAYVLSRGHEIMPNMRWNRTGTGVRISVLTIGTEQDDEELWGEYGSYGDRDDQIIWPAGMALDSKENIYITDEWLNRASIFDKGGSFLKHWGSTGSGDGQLVGPSGIHIDGGDNLHIVDSRNHRVQKFTKDGEHLGKWGGFGDGVGEMDSPWGIAMDGDGHVYVADHKNHRVQKFSQDGEYVVCFGSFGTGRGQLRYPTDVDVDPDGDVYVADWANDRVQVYAPDGRFMTSFIGDSQVLSRWGKMTVEANPDTVKRRREVGNLQKEWRFDMPRGVTFDARKSRLLVADTQRMRIQIYNKVKDYVEPQRNL